MAQTYKVMASGRHAVHTSGFFTAETPQEAEEMARQAYRRSVAGWTVKDETAFRFYVVWDREPDAK